MRCGVHLVERVRILEATTCQLLIIAPSSSTGEETKLPGVALLGSLAQRTQRLVVQDEQQKSLVVFSAQVVNQGDSQQPVVIRYVLHAQLVPNN